MPLPRAGAVIFDPRFHVTVQAVEEAGMPDDGAIHRGLIPVFNSADGTLEASGPAVWCGPCRVQRPVREQVQTSEHGDAYVSLLRYVVSIPHDAPEIKVDDTFTTTRSADCELVGRSMTVRAVTFDSFLSRRLLHLEDRPQVVPT